MPDSTIRDNSLIQLQLEILRHWKSEDPQLKLNIRALNHAIQQNMPPAEKLNIVHRILLRQEQLMQHVLEATYDHIRRIRD